MVFEALPEDGQPLKYKLAQSHYSHNIDFTHGCTPQSTIHIIFIVTLTFRPDEIRKACSYAL